MQVYVIQSVSIPIKNAQQNPRMVSHNHKKNSHLYIDAQDSEPQKKAKIRSKYAMQGYGGGLPNLKQRHIFLFPRSGAPGFPHWAAAAALVAETK